MSVTSSFSHLSERFAENTKRNLKEQYSYALLGYNDIGKNDVKQDYIDPVIIDNYSKTPEIQRPLPHKISVRIPGRLNFPLVPYGPLMQKYALDRDYDVSQRIQATHSAPVKELHLNIDKYCWDKKLLENKLQTGIDKVKRFVRLPYSRRAEFNHFTSYINAVKAAKSDLEMLSSLMGNEYSHNPPVPIGIDLMYLIQRIRPLICSGKSITSSSKFEASIERLPNSVIRAYCHNNDYKYELLLCGGHFSIMHSDCDFIFIGPLTYLDYIYTIADVINNSNIIGFQAEYKSFNLLLIKMSELIISSKAHNELVSFFKAYESMCLFIADIQSHTTVNWEPIIDGLNSMVEISNRVSKDQINIQSAMYSIIMETNYSYTDSLYLTIITELRKLDPQELLEASSLHKFLYFAEVDTEAGLKKFLKRTHTKRTVEAINSTQLVSLTKQEFCVNYFKRNKVLPNIEEPLEKSILLQTYISGGNLSDILLLPLGWWNDVKFGKTLEKLDGGHPVEYAKDKAAIKYDITFGPSDTINELVAVMSNEDYKADEFLDDISEEIKPSYIYRGHTEAIPRHVRFPVRLCAKEKEQKIEARLFGVAPAPLKHKLSQYMNQAKIVLDYLKEQNMTISDKERKTIHHAMAQSLSDPDCFAVMMDIEGHNQSMQPENTYELLEFIGSLFGEKGWGKLSLLFNNLTVYWYDYYTTDTIVSTGQLGGIEGWMNPVWTMVTLQQLKLLRENTQLKIPKLACYSDDVVLILKLIQKEQGDIDEVLRIISKECYRLGFIVKASQSGVSKYRITLLRQHSIKGIRADATLKRLLSVSTANNQKLVADEFEINAISSTVSSALDCSYHIRTCTILKWYKSFFLTSHLIGSIFSERRENSMISPDMIPTELANTLYNLDGLKPTDIPNVTGHVTKSIMIDLERCKDPLGNKKSEEYYLNWLFRVENSSLEQMKLSNSTDFILYKSSENKYIQEIWHLLLMIPSSMGGLGVELLINQSLSGNSDSIYKALYYIHRIISHCFTNRDLMFKIFTNILKYHSPGAKEIHPMKVLNSKWVTSNDISTVQNMLNNRLISVMRKLNKNKELHSMLEFKSIEPVFITELDVLFKSKYNHRVIQFYYENSVISMVQFLLRKLETSTNLIKYIFKLSDFLRDASNKSRFNLIRILMKGECLFGNINSETNMLTYLIDRRRAILPSYKFLEIEEPLYDHLLVPSEDSQCIIGVYPSSPYNFINNKFSFKEGVYESQTLYKGEISDEDTLLSTREEMLVSKLVSVTKWMINKDITDTLNIKSDEVLAFEHACNLSLMTLCDKTYTELEINVPLNLGGEILHRIPNQRFRSKVSTKILPNSTQYIGTVLYQSSVLELKLEDTNVNFELMRMRLAISYAYRYHYNGELPTMVDYKLETLQNIHIVQDYKSYVVKRREIPEELINHRKLNDRIHLEKISIASVAYMYDEDVVNGLSIFDKHKYTDLKALLKTREEAIIMDYYEECCKNDIFIDADLSNELTWHPLLTKLKGSYKKFLVMSNSEAIDYILTIVSKGIVNQYKDNIDLDQTGQFKTKIKMLREKMKIHSTAYLRLKYTFTNLDKEDIIDNIPTLRRAPYTNLQLFFTSIARELFKDLASGIGMSIQLSKGVITLDPVKTYDKTLYYIQNYEAIQIMSDVLKAIILFCHPNRLVKLLKSQRNRLIQYLGRVSEDTLTLFIHDSKLNIKYETPHILKPVITLPNEVLNSRYTGFTISPQELINIELIHNSLKVIRRISELYADTWSFYSVTGSDSVVSQYGLYLYLLSLNLIDEHRTLISLASGRGDSRYVADAMKLPSFHYSQKDLYNQIKIYPGVITDYSFDLTDSKTLDFVTSNCVVVIDISYLKGSQEGLLDTILNLLLRDNVVIVRLNAITTMNQEFIDSAISLSTKITWIYPSSYGLLPYQQYLLFQSGKSSSSQQVRELRNTTGYKEMMRHYFSHISANRLLSTPTMIEGNSMTDQLAEWNDPLELLNILRDGSTIVPVIRSLRRLISLGILEPTIPLDNMTINHLMKSYNFPTMLSDDGTIDRIYGDVSTSDCGLSEGKGYRYWSRTINEYNAGKDRGISIRVDTDDRELIRAISHTHPLERFRSYTKNLYTVIISGLHNGSYDIVSLQALHDNLIIDNKQINDKMSKDFRFILALIIICAVKFNYRYGILLLSPAMEEKKKNNLSAHKRLNMYRKLSSIYIWARSNAQKFLPHMNLIEEIEQNYINPEKRLKIKQVSNYRLEEVTENPDTFKDLANRTLDGFLENILQGKVSYMPTINNLQSIPQNDNNDVQKFTELDTILNDKASDKIKSNEVQAGFFDTSAILQQSLEGVLNSSDIMTRFTYEMNALPDLKDLIGEFSEEIDNDEEILREYLENNNGLQNDDPDYEDSGTIVHEEEPIGQGEDRNFWSPINQFNWADDVEEDLDRG